jgi:hypothetical protein
MTAFWDIQQCILVGVDEVSEAHTASIIRAVHQGSYGGEYEDDSLLGYTAVYSRRSRRRFRGAYCLYHQGDSSRFVRRRV